MSQKKKLVIIAIILIIVVVAGIVVAMAMGGSKNHTTDKTGHTSDTTPQQDALLGPTFTDSKTGVTVRVPKDWELAPKSAQDPNSLTKFQHSKSRANGELSAIKANVNIDDIVRPYLEGAINVDYKRTLIENRDIVIGNKPTRWLMQDIPGPDNQTARLTQYIFFKDGTYYILSYSILGTEWETLRPSIEASAASLHMK